MLRGVRTTRKRMLWKSDCPAGDRNPRPWASTAILEVNHPRRHPTACEGEASSAGAPRRVSGGRWAWCGLRGTLSHKEKKGAELVENAGPVADYSSEVR